MLPYLTETRSPTKQYSIVFRGVNYGEGTQDGEFAETYNLSTDQYPCITQRAARIETGGYTAPTTLHSKGQLLVIDERDDGTGLQDVYYGNAVVGEVTSGKKQTATIGNYIVIFPDKAYYKVPTEEDKDGEFGSMEETYTDKWFKFTASTISMTNEYKATGLKFSDGTTISKSGADFPFIAGDVVTITGAKTSTSNSSLTNNKTDVVIKDATSDTLTFEEDTFYFKYTEESEVTIKLKENREANFPFKEGDAVTITGCSNNGNNKTAEIIVRSVTSNEMTFDDNTFTETTEYGEITIKRTVPDLDFICESNYRLWGTHGNTIYSSKFSDPFNFQVFDGLSSDSYAIEVGSEGEFTGCIPYSSHICFFKENTLHKLYGTKPSNFQINTVNVYGVQSGSERSMQIVNEQLLYQGVGGVYAYTGGVPELISEKFGNRRYSDAVACCDGEKYYISMKQGDTWNMFTYDVMKNIWLREDDTQAVDMTFFDGKVYYLVAEGGLYYIDKTADRSDIEWGATFCTMHETMNERKGYSKFHLRMDLSAGAWFAVDIKTDSDLQWRQIYTTHNEKAKTVSIPIIPTRCDSIDIRLRGKGKCTIKTFIREFTVGSDV
ncbi:MAG: hypothetical protein IJ300_01515 [Clostridia bacterium]|nr:hypothetical protein [Clostridia bacterium]